MSDPLNASTPSSAEVPPDPQDLADPAELQSAGDLDEDELNADPLEEGVEPPEAWSEVSESRPTPREQRAGDSIDERLSEERPDAEEDAPGGKPLAEAREHELDESVDEQAEAEVADGVGGDTARPSAATEHGAALRGEQDESTGLAAATNEGSAGRAPSGASPEEDAERVQDVDR